jgi:hypothetical protein
MDSATRSYTAWALARCGGALRYDPGLDSATRSYMAMAWSLQCRASP